MTKTPHKHAELIKAWADGNVIQYRAVPGRGNWCDFESQDDVLWDNFSEYRIKPEPKPDVVAEGIITWNGKDDPEIASYSTRFRVSEHYERDNIRLTFDGETGKLKKAEVME